MNWGLNKIILTDGRSLPTDERLSFDWETYEFWYANERITDLISHRQKLALVPDFDEQLDNNRLSNKRTGRTGIDPLEENTGLIFGGQILTDPLTAPREAVARQLSAVFQEPAFKVLGVLVLIGVGLYLSVKLSK